MGYITLNELFEKINSVQEWTEEQKSKCKKYLMEHGLQEMYDKTDVELYAFKYNEAGEIDLEESIIFNGFNIEYSYKKDFTTGETVRRPMTANKYELYGMDLQRLVDLGYVDSIPREWLEPYYYAQVETVYKYELKSDILGNHTISLGRKGFAYSMKSDDVAVNVMWSLGVGIYTNVDAEWLNGLKEAIRYLAKPRPSVAYNVIYTVCSIIDDMLVVLLEDEVVEAIENYINSTGAGGGESYTRMYRNEPSWATWHFGSTSAEDMWVSDAPSPYIPRKNGYSVFKLMELAIAHRYDWIKYLYATGYPIDDSDVAYCVNNAPYDVFLEMSFTLRRLAHINYLIKSKIGVAEAGFMQDLKNTIDNFQMSKYGQHRIDVNNVQCWSVTLHFNTCPNQDIYDNDLDLQRTSDGKKIYGYFNIEPIYSPDSSSSLPSFDDACEIGLLQISRPNPKIQGSYRRNGDFIYLTKTYIGGNFTSFVLTYRPDITLYYGRNVLEKPYRMSTYGVQVDILEDGYRMSIPDYVQRNGITQLDYYPTIFHYDVSGLTTTESLQVKGLETHIDSYTHGYYQSPINGTFSRDLVDLPEIPIEPTIFRPVNPEPIEPRDPSDPDPVDPTIPSPLDNPEPDQPPINPEDPNEGEPPMQDDGQTPDIPDMLEGVGFNIFRPSENNLNSLIAKLWSNDFKDKFNAAINNPIDSIISLHILYALPQTGEHKNIYLGNYDTGISSAPVTQRYKTINCGSITIPEYFEDLRDYAPFTTVELFIPFTGMVKLDTNTVMGSAIVLTIRVDSFTGSTLAEVRVIKGSMSAVLYTFEGNCAVSIPLTGAIYNNFMSGVFGVVGGIADVVGGVATAHPLNAISGGVNAVESAISSFENHSSRSGSFTSNALAMTSRIPYLVIDRTRAYDTEYSDFMGYATNKRVRVGSVSGYLRAHDVKVDIPTATDEEKEMIKALLEEGIYV